MNRSRLLNLTLRLGLMLGGVACALLTLAGLFALFPDLLPARLRDPLDQREANKSMHVRFMEDQGDLFIAMPGNVRPPEDPQLLAEFDIRWDEDGFRVPAMTAETYPIIVLGDSFTEAPNAAVPWPDVLARELEMPVRNLGYRGYGPVEYQAIFEEFGKGEHTWILIGFFEGNDLENIRTSTQESAADRLQNLAREQLEFQEANLEEDADGQYQYPLGIVIGADYFELAFYNSYLWMLNADVETYAESRNLELFAATVSAIMEQTDACVGVVYLPSKEHIYFPYAEEFGRRWILDTGHVTRNYDGWLGGSEEIPQEFETYLAQIGNQREAVQVAVQATGATFIDLTPAFEDAAAAGEILYYKYDSHWNQAGHDRAGAVVADALQKFDGECR